MVGLAGEIVSAGAAPIASTTFVVYAVPDKAVAVILQELPCAAEAVKRPDELMMPQDTDHETGELAVNCCVCPCGVLALAGVIAMGDTTVAVVAALWPLPSDAVAVTVHDDGLKGAMKRPAEEIVPHDVV